MLSLPSLFSICLLSLFFCFFFNILSPLFSALHPFSVLSFSVSILSIISTNSSLSLLSTLYMLSFFLSFVCLMFWYFTFFISTVLETLEWTGFSPGWTPYCPAWTSACPGWTESSPTLTPRTLEIEKKIITQNSNTLMLIYL